MAMKKKEIEEVIDSDGNLIGSDSRPQISADVETQADGTTDQNAMMHGQNFKNDFLGRFGFYFYESVNNEPSQVLEDVAKVVGSMKTANAVMEVIKPHLEKAIDETYPVMNESKVVEDKVIEKKTDKGITNKTTKGLNANSKEVADILSKLPKDDLNKLKNLLEKK